MVGCTRPRRRTMTTSVGSDKWTMQVEFKIHIEEHGDTLRIIIAGELDLATVPQLNAQLALAEAGDSRLIVMDLERVSFIDSSGLRALLEAEARSRQNGSRLRITPGNSQAEKLFKLTGTHDRLHFLPSTGSDRCARPGPDPEDPHVP